MLASACPPTRTRPVLIVAGPEVAARGARWLLLILTEWRGPVDTNAPAD